ncbi:MAG: type II toxin-antitoxin system HicB family antitoxin [bacterium]|nr:type II toxin-antitoxin system HicB family antitoxin [bacterium]MDZ4299348.1 type II toxin-antitoxin system HicB family antitoxin [Candidatus Sungbacteria bacterium]
MLHYSVKLQAQKEGGFTVTVPALPGCISEGETMEEALENIADAIEGYVIVLAKHNRPIPVEIPEYREVEVFTRRTSKRRTLVHA